MTMPISAAASLSIAGSAAGNGGPLSNGSFPYGLAMRFQVSVGGLSLGSWSACKGLKVELKTIRAAEGGNYWSERVLPEKITYSTITLERAVHPQDSKVVQTWLQQVASQWMNYAPPDTTSGTPYKPATAIIRLLGAYGQPVMDWKLMGVYPVSWTGPSLSATENKVAIETLELAHEGFLDWNTAVPGQ
jgi:phage tail-like protein